MRCPYCGGPNVDQAQFCVRCGRDISAKPPTTTASRSRASYPPSQQQPSPYQPPRVPSPAQGYPRPVAPQPPPRQQPRSAPPTSTPSTTIRRTSVPQPPPQPPVPVAPEPPAPFPPHTIQQLKALEQGALQYSMQSETESVGRKKTVRILYQPCTAWQQAATLLKALKEHQSDKFNTIVIQGIYSQENSVYEFTNGQLRFDHNVRLGSQVMNRYQIETGNSFESNSIRIVLSE